MDDGINKEITVLKTVLDELTSIRTTQAGTNIGSSEPLLMQTILEQVEMLSRRINEKIHGTYDDEGRYGLLVMKQEFNEVASRLCNIVFEEAKKNGDATWIATHIHTKANWDDSFVAPQLIELCIDASWNEPLDTARVNSRSGKARMLIDRARKNRKIFAEKIDSKMETNMRQIGNSVRAATPEQTKNATGTENGKIARRR